MRPCAQPLGVRHLVDRRLNVKVVGLAVVGLILLSGAIFVFVTRPGALTVTCHLDESKLCDDTASSIIGFPEMELHPPLTGRLIAIDIRPAPPEWANSVDPGFRAAGWAALLQREDAPPILAACYYDSDPMVACDTEERQTPAPSN